MGQKTSEREKTEREEKKKEKRVTSLDSMSKARSEKIAWNARGVP
jgi:muramoyltetrapeptide carboxypeptidase LdcA involved in peptidoglycan recycling